MELEKQIQIPKILSPNMDILKTTIENSMMVLTLNYLPTTIISDKYGRVMKIPINVMFTDED